MQPDPHRPVCRQAKPADEVPRPITVRHIGRRHTTAGTAGTAPAPDALVPLTPLQLVHLTHSLLNPADLTSHRLLTWVVDGRPDRAALATAVAAVHRRHASLRAAYRVDPSPVAQILDSDPPPLEELPEQPSVEPAIAALRALFASELLVQEGDVWRTAVVSAGPCTVVGCLVHHVAFDSWSESVLARDLSTAYRAAVRGEAPAAGPAVPGRPVWTQLRSTAHDPAQRYREELAGVPALRWPIEPAPSHPGGPALIEVWLPDQVVTATRQRGVEAGVSRHTVLLAEYAATLAEVTGQRDFAIGVPVAQRDDPHLQDAVGCHIAMTCLRLRGVALTGGVAGLQEVGQLFDAARDVPLHDLVSAVALHEGPSPPLFQTVFELPGNAPVQLTLDGMRTSRVRQPYLDLSSDLRTELSQGHDGGLLLMVHFRPDVVAWSTAAEIAKCYERRLSAVLE